MVICIKVYSQAEGDTLTYEYFIQTVLDHHPFAKKANLKVTFGEAEMLKAKGNFDPSLFSHWSEKNFDDKLYYRQYAGHFRAPTPLGVDIVGGYENTLGDFLNSENFTDPNGLWHIGVELDVLQGLFINERSTILKQARRYQHLAKNEQQIMANELLYNASYAYLQWQLFYYFGEVLKENAELASKYFENTRDAFLGGEKTAMDTLEAHILHQDAIIELQKNELKLIKTILILENYLWYENEPIALQNDTKPELYFHQIWEIKDVPRDPFKLDNNPQIAASINKLSILEIEQRLKREKLKPKLKLKYNPLLSTSANGISPNYSIDNYSWGFVFSMPLLYRSERGNIQQGEIKMAELNLDIESKRNELSNKIETSRQQLALLQEQQILIEQNTENYRMLLEGENEKFRYGESSVFLLNKRQEKYITTRIKLIDNHIKLQLERLKYLYYTNRLIDPNFLD